MTQELLGHYEIVQQLRVEPLGRVVTCREPGSGRELLGKELFLPRHLTEGARQELTFNFRLALRALEEANSPAFAPLLHWGQEGAQHYALFALPTGETAAEIIGQGRRLPPTEALLLVRTCAAALQVLQENQVGPSVADPRNVCVTPAGGALWAELGFSHYLRESGDATTRSATDELQTQSPEELAGEPVSEASLVFSLAALLYRLIAGEAPYPGEDAGALRAAIEAGKHEPLWRRATGVPAGTDELLTRALRVAPQSRYPNVAELAAALAALIPADANAPAADAGAPEPAPLPPRSWKRALAGNRLVFGAAAALAGLVAWSLLRPPKSPVAVPGAPGPEQAAVQRPVPSLEPAAPLAAAPRPAVSQPSQQHTEQIPRIRYQQVAPEESTTLSVARPREVGPPAPRSSPSPQRPAASADRPQRRAGRPVALRRPTAVPQPTATAQPTQPPEPATPAAPTVQEPPAATAPETAPTGLPPGVKRRF